MDYKNRKLSLDWGAAVPWGAGDILKEEILDYDDWLTIEKKWG